MAILNPVLNGDSGLIARNKINTNDQNLSDQAGQNENDIADLETDKADIASPSTAGNVAELDANGNLVDSGAATSSLLINPVTSIDFNPQDPILSYERGRMFFDDTRDSFSYFVDGINEQELRVNEQNIVRIKNVSGAPITRGQALAVVGVEDDTALVVLAIANDRTIAQATLAIAIFTVADEGFSFGLRFGGGVTLDTSTFDLQDLLYLSATIPGGITNVAPVPPNYVVILGIVGSVGVSGDVGIRVNGFQGNDTSTNSQGIINGLVTQTPNVVFSVSGGIIYADVTNEDDPTKDLPFMIGNTRYLLDTTTGSGPGGEARVIIPPGASATAKQSSIIYIYLDGVTPTIAVATTQPVVAFAKIADVVVFDDVRTLADGKPLGYRRSNDAVDSNAEGVPGMYGLIHVMLDAMRSKLGSGWLSGQDGTPTVDDSNILLALSAGVGAQLHTANLPLFDGLSYLIYNDSSNAITYAASTNLTDITLDANGGSLLSINTYYPIRIFYQLNSNGIGNNVIATRPLGSYSTSAEAISDPLNYGVSINDTDIEEFVYPLYDIVIARTGAGGATINLVQLTDNRKKLVGGEGGGGGAQGGSTDQLVRVSAADTTNDYLNPKITVGSGLVKSISNPGANESILIEKTESIQLSASGETTILAIGTSKVTFRMAYALTLTEVRASVTTAPTGADLIVDINESGVSVLSTKLSIDAGEKTSTTAAVPPVISDAALADDSEITIDIDQVGSTIAGVGLKVTLIGTR